MAKKKPTSTDLTDQSLALAEFAAKALVGADQLGVKKKPIQDVPLDETERAIAACLPSISATLKRKLKTRTGTFTVADTARIVMALAQSLLDGEQLQRLRLLFISKKLTDCLQTNVVPAVPTEAKSKSNEVDADRHGVSIQDHAARCQASDLATDLSAGLHARQTPRTNPRGNWLDQQPSAPVRQ